MVSTPKPWLLIFHPDWHSASPSRGGLGGILCPEEGGVNLPLPEISGWSLPLAYLPDAPLFQVGKIANVHPFPNTPPCAPIPRRESKRGHTI